MTAIVTDTGFSADDWAHGYFELDELSSDSSAVRAVDVPSDADPEVLRPFLDRIEMIRIEFPSFADGRGFTIARQLRLMGFEGRLRAKGHVISDQYAMARRSGFDEVEIDDALAARQPEAQWCFRANWRDHDYQAKLRA
ncbi:hypothetical protein JI58_07645 [Marinosulfonomonas sp. PRT-SC04]|nr:hypothetical protein JI58_07645 [Marinosulfonomonas sp. PRT-SC04]